MSELVNTNCPHCGAGIQVNPEFKEQLVCRYCGSTFFVKDVSNTVNYNNITINNYNSGGEEKLQDLTERYTVSRERTITEIEKLKDYFSQKKDLYDEVEKIDDILIPQCKQILELYKKKAYPYIAWGIVIMCFFSSVANIWALLGFTVFDYEDLWYVLALVMFVLLIFGGIPLIVFGNKKIKEYRKKVEKDIKVHTDKKEQIVKELKEYYRKYKSSPICINLTFPKAIDMIYYLIIQSNYPDIGEAARAVSHKFPLYIE